MKTLIIQIFKFGIVGGICFVIDYGLMVFFKEVCGTTELVASGISFTVSVIVNYILSMRYVFHGKENRNVTVELIVFILLSVCGLLINQLIMWAGVKKLFISYLIVKFFATAVVMVFNFVTRKLFLEDRKAKQ